jgi:hypothetical protein
MSCSTSHRSNPSLERSSPVMTHVKLARLGVIAIFHLAFASPLSAAWKEKVLYSFQGGNDGSVPAGRRVAHPL